MSESGFTQFPAGPKLPEQARHEKGNGEPNTRLVRVPKDLREVRKAIKLRGEVVRENRDGSVRVRTPRGDIDIRTPPDQPPPKSGQKIEIEIQPGRPPERAVVRPANQNPDIKQETSQSRPQTGTKPDATIQQTPPRSTATPVNVDVQNTAAEKTQPITIAPAPTISTKQAKALPPIGSIVRLQPLPTGNIEANILPPDPAETIVSTATQTTAFKAQLIVLKTQDILQSEVLTIQTTSVSLPPENVTVPPPVQDILIQHGQSPALTPQTTPLQILSDFTAAQTQPQVPTTLTDHVKLIPEPNTLSTPAILETIRTESQIQTHQPLSPTQAPKTQTTEPLLTKTVSQELLFLLPPKLQTPPIPSEILQPAITVETNFTERPIKTVTNTPLQPLDVRIENILPPSLELQPVELPQENVVNKITATEKPIPVLENHRAEAITATVTGITEEQLPVLSVSLPKAEKLQNFVLQIPVDTAIPGTQIHVTPHITAQTMPLSTITPEQIHALPQLLTPAPWPLMTEIYQTLAQTAPQTAQALSNITPNPANSAQLGPAALFFIAAVKGGDMNGWLGNRATDVLRREGRGNLLTRMTQESGLLSRLAAEPISQDWRAVNLPLFWDNEIQKIALYYKHDHPKDDSDNPQGKQTRFLFDLNLPNMGQVQLDGLHRTNRLDLIVRTEEQFSQAMQMDMRRTYTIALEQTELAGELSFQNSPEQWVTIDIEEKTSDVTV